MEVLRLRSRLEGIVFREPRWPEIEQHDKFRLILNLIFKCSKNAI